MWKHPVVNLTNEVEVKELRNRFRIFRDCGEHTGIFYQFLFILMITWW